MAYFDKETVARWTSQAKDWLESKLPVTLSDVKTGKDAWTVAHRCGITKEAYKDRNVVDAHIQTALESIFPNAVFMDKKRY